MWDIRFRTTMLMPFGIWRNVVWRTDWLP